MYRLVPNTGKPLVPLLLLALLILLELLLPLLLLLPGSEEAALPRLITLQSAKTHVSVHVLAIVCETVCKISTRSNEPPRIGVHGGKKEEKKEKKNINLADIKKGNSNFTSTIVCTAAIR